MQKICVIGSEGYIGKAMVNMLKDHYEVIKIDPSLEASADYLDTEDCVLSIVCVPTPMKEDGSCDTSIVEKVVSQIRNENILIKSTVKPGTTTHLSCLYNKNIVFSPEYIGESKYWVGFKFGIDMKETPFLILGGAIQDTKYVLDLFAPILGPEKTYYQCTSTEAELIKYMDNTYFATKVIFANEMKQICDAIGVDYNIVRTGWSLDPRVDKMHTMVFKNEYGFGGKCFPKDVNALVKASEEAGYNPEFLKEVLRTNSKLRKLNK
jgi:nucleotide sugar dehydrogenase